MEKVAQALEISIEQGASSSSSSSSPLEYPKLACHNIVVSWNLGFTNIVGQLLMVDMRMWQYL
jgi:hypothetical protein